MEGTIGEIRMFAPSFAPEYWAFCNGQMLAVNTYTALFSVIGTFYGGNGSTNFALPDMRGRVAIGVGQGTALSNYNLGQQVGLEAATLLAGNLPTHSHTVSGTIKVPTTAQAATAMQPANNYFAGDGSSRFNGTNKGKTMKPANLNISFASVGSGTTISNMMPYLGINYIICLQGIYPSRP